MPRPGVSAPPTPLSFPLDPTSLDLSYTQLIQGLAEEMFLYAFLTETSAPDAEPDDIPDPPAPGRADDDAEDEEEA